MPANSLSLIRIVDDDAEMRESLEFLLSTEGWKSRSYASAEAFLETDDVMVPGCLILDIRMPGLSGLQLQELLKKKDYSLPILFITAHGDITMAVEAVKNGAFDFLPKPLDDEKLLASVEKAVALDWERRSHHTSHAAAMKDLATLTPREREVAGLVAEGLLNKVIAERLGIAEKTVQIHRGQVCRKLKVRSAVEISRILDQAEQTKGYVPGETPVVVVGMLPSSSVSMERPGFESLADHQGVRYTYAAAYEDANAWYLRMILGSHVQLVEDSVMRALSDSPEAQAMPCFPSEGFCQMIDGMLYIRLS